MISAIRNRTITYAAALLAAVLLFSVLSVMTAPTADAACGKYHWYTTGSSFTSRLAYDFQTSSWLWVSASWGPEGTVATTGTCQDVNVRNNNKSTSSRAMYYATSYSRWAHGSAGWEWGPIDQYVVAISNLPVWYQVQGGGGVDQYQSDSEDVASTDVVSLASQTSKANSSESIFWAPMNSR